MSEVEKQEALTNSASEDSGFAANEYEREPVPETKTKGLKSFVGLFAGEHVAATELLIGPLFVVAGASAFSVLVGLLVGNFLAVMSWTFLTAPIAVKNRLTLYYQLEKIGGPAIIKLYNAANGFLWCCLGGAFIYVSATALFVPFNIPTPAITDWAPKNIGMVVVITVVGAVFVYMAAKGYDTIAHFANIASPWMTIMFIIFGLSALPELGVKSLGDFWRVANNVVWTGVPAAGAIKFTFWHIVCFAWFGNMAWHIGMGDLSIFRYARKARYGLASAAGMYLGHYIAWITAALLYAVQLQRNPADTSVVPGPLASRVAGYSGILLVLLAGWTTANPVIYRAGLAFQAIRPKWSRVWVTLVAGALACVVAAFPGFCNRFLSVAMLYGLILMPMGAVIFADHYLVRKIGLVKFYAEKASKHVYWPPVLAWVCSLLVCVLLWYFAGIQEFFLCLPGWLASGVIYLALSKIMQKPLKSEQVTNE